MIILDTAGDTIQAEASAASSITVSCYGIETASGTDTYKRLGVAQLTGSGTQDTVYTVPASTVTICSVIVIANTSGSSRTIKLWDVENTSSPGDANAILGTITIPANTSIIWNKGNITEIPNAAGGIGTDEKVGIDSGATAGYLGAASGDGVLRTSSPLIYVDGGNFITLSLDAGLTNLATIAMGADKFYYTSADNTHVAATVTSFARSILDDADEAAFKATVNLEIGTDVLAQQTIGIANNNLLEVDHVSPADNDYAKFTASGLEGRSYAEVLSDIGAVAVSGQTLLIFTPQSNEPPSSNFATFDTRNQHPVLDFALNEISVFSSILPRQYAGGGITIYLHYAMTSAVANDIKLEVSFERIGDQQQDIDSDGFAAVQNSGDITVPGASGNVDIIAVTFTDGAQMDSLAVGEGFRLKIKRIAVAGTDASGDLELRFIEIKES